MMSCAHQRALASDSQNAICYDDRGCGYNRSPSTASLPIRERPYSSGSYFTRVNSILRINGRLHRKFVGRLYVSEGGPTTQQKGAVLYNCRELLSVASKRNQKIVAVTNNLNLTFSVLWGLPLANVFTSALVATNQKQH